MGFKYEEDRIFIVASKYDAFIRAYGTKFGADLEIEAKLKPGELYRAWCFNGKFIVYNNYVQLTLTAEQLDDYFREPYTGLEED
jgi:hypothetical protein